MLTACRIMIDTVQDDKYINSPTMFMGFNLNAETAPYLATILRISEEVARAEDRIKTLEFDKQEIETENAALIAKNARLERFVEKAIEKLAIRCPLQRWERYCPKPDNISCTTCWREFLMQTDDATQAEIEL